MHRIPSNAPENIADSRRVGGAAVEVLLAVAAALPRAVLENSWHAQYAVPALQSLPGAIFEVFCRCPPELAYERYLERAEIRHPGHFDSARDRADLYTAETIEPLAGGWPVVEVDTADPVDIDVLVQAIRWR